MAPRSRLERSEISICGKYFIFFVNFAFLVISPIALGFGIYIAAFLKVKSVTSFVDILLDPSIYLLIFGIPGTIISFLGCLGSLREITGVLRVYYWLVNIFLIFELLGVVFVFVFAFSPETLIQLKIYPEDLLKDAITKYRTDLDMEDFIDDIQQDWGCCGYSDKVDGYTDWGANEYFNCTDANKSFEKCAVPWSCCKFEAGETVNLLCGGDALQDGSGTTSKINQNGCLYLVRTFILNNIIVIAGVVLACFIGEIILVHFARNLKDQIELQRMKWRRN